MDIVAKKFRSGNLAYVCQAAVLSSLCQCIKLFKVSFSCLRYNMRFGAQVLGLVYHPDTMVIYGTYKMWFDEDLYLVYCCLVCMFCGEKKIPVDVNPCPAE